MKFKCSKKRLSAFLLMFGCLTFPLSGCGKSDDALSVMIPLQKDSFQDFFELFLKKNPTVNFNMSAYRGGSTSAYLLQRFEMNDLTDIVITSYPPEGEIQEETLLDLSGYNFVNNYKATVLNNLDVNGSIYLLECPSSVRGIAYNKTMFEKNNWKVPTSHEEFISLIKQISDESEVMPLGIQGKYPGAYFTLMSELSYCDYLQTPSGQEWMRDFAKGDASSSDGFKYGLDLLKDWLDAGAFDSSQMTLGDSTLYQKFVNERWCAMSYVMGSQNKLVEMAENSEDEFGMFPIYGKGKDSEFVATTYGLKVGINKKLAEKGNEKKLANALKIMEFLSTEEGQMVFHTGKGDILPLTGISSTLSSMFNEVSAVIDRGHFAPFLYPGYEDILANAGDYIREVCNNGGDLSGVFAVMDQARKNTLENKGNYIATVSETLDENQTAQFIANALYDQGYGDFALVSKGKYSEHFDIAGGANGKLYKGGITSMAINLPLSNLAAQECVTMSLSGSQVIDLLNKGRILSDEQGHEDYYEYYSAGITVNSKKDGSIESVIFNGSPLIEDKIYNVAFAPQDYSAELKTIGNPTNTGISWEKAYLAYIEKLEVITPSHASKK